MSPTDLEAMIRDMKATERDAIETVALAVVEAVKAVGAVSIMPSPAMPLTGLLLHVHPKIYDRLQSMKLEASKPDDDEFNMTDLRREGWED